MKLDSESVLYEVKDGIGYVTLNRPVSGNSISVEMERTLPIVWGDVRDNPDVRVAILTGAGERHFCTGLDLTEAAVTGLLGREGPLLTDILLSPRQNNVWKPVICAVNGTVVGGGLHFVVDSDIVVAVPYAEFIDSHVNVGQVGGIENIGLAKRLPLGTALRMTMVGVEYRLSAERAYHFGLVDELASVGDLMNTSVAIAEQIKKNSPRAVSLSQQAIWKSLEVGHTEAMEFGWEMVKLHREHPDSVEGPKAFSEKREPNWVE
jgi:enoyl-CoA hydratase/carnithine racemase